MISLPSALPILITMLCCCHAAAFADPPVHLTLLSTGAAEKLGGGRPQLLQLSDVKPAEVKRVPPNLNAPRYGTLTMGSKENPQHISVILDEANGKKSRLFVDTNGDGDLTNDPSAEWEPRPYGTDLQMLYGGAKIKLKYGANAFVVHIGMFRFDKNDERRKPLQDKIVYFSDYAYEGQITLGDARYDALLTDDHATGDYRGTSGDEASVRLLIDVNGNGRFDQRGEAFDIGRPFNIRGTTYEITNMSASGAAFEIVKSAKSVAEVPPPNNVSKGQAAVPFEAIAQDGTTIHFPADYKGKLVLLTFWATWYPLARAEVPNLVKAYSTYHSQNFDIVGVCLDAPNAADKLTAFLKEQKADWPQIYDGKGWENPVAQLYSLSDIPHAFLVDADTGKIVAEGLSLTGPALLPTINAALEKKHKR